MSTKSAQNITLEVKRLIKAPRERVFAAWTTPADILEWFGSESCRPLAAKIDLRVGGEYRFRTQSETFGELEAFGVYREINRPSRLVFTWQSNKSPLKEIGETLVTVEFVEVGEGTEVRLRHEGFPTGEFRDQHGLGWNGGLNKLEKFLGSSAGTGCAAVGQFSWNELVSQDVAASAAFYSKLFGWQTEAFGPTGDYSLFKSGNTPVGGVMKCQASGIPAHWLAYVSVADCNASVQTAKALGAKVYVEPKDIPTVGRIAVIQDLQGAAFGLFEPEKK